MSTPASPAGPTAAESGSGPDEAGLDGLAAAEDALAAEADRAHEDNASLVRSSGIMAAGTLVSRITGFFRTAVFGYALGPPPWPTPTTTPTRCPTWSTTWPSAAS